MYRVITNMTLVIYENWTILHWIIQLIIFKVCILYTRFVVTEHEGKVNTAHYYN